LHLTDYRPERRDEAGRYAGVRRETLLNGVSDSVSYCYQLYFGTVRTVKNIQGAAIK